MSDSSALGHTGEQAVLFRGKVITLALSPAVAAPNYYTYLLTGYLAEYETRCVSVADLGSGTGIFSIIANRFLGASRVWAIDINPSAVDLTRENCARNGCPPHDVMIEQADLAFVRPRHTFDLLIANPPQIPSPDGEPTCSGGSTGRATIEKIIELACHCLSNSGALIMTAADFVGIPAVMSFAESRGLDMEVVRSQVCAPGPYTLKHKRYIESTGYVFRDSVDGATFVLHALSFRRHNVKR